jgi:hypothetical protein
MMLYNVEGTVTHVGEKEVVGNGFEKRLLVIKTSGEYSQDLAFEATKDRMQGLDHVYVGDLVDVKFGIRGREYNGKYYTNLTMIGLVVKLSGNHDETSQVTPEERVEEKQDGLPF